MPWKHDQRRAAAGKLTVEERKVWSAGYSDGFHGARKFAGCEEHYLPRIYTAGFDAGREDREVTQPKE